MGIWDVGGPPGGGTEGLGPHLKDKHGRGHSVSIPPLPAGDGLAIGVLSKQGSLPELK